MAGAYGGGYGGNFLNRGRTTHKEKMRFLYFMLGFVISLCLFVEGMLIYRLFSGLYLKPRDLIIPPVIILVFIILTIIAKNNTPKNFYKEKGIRIMAKVEEFEKYSCYDTRHTRQAGEHFTDYSNSGYERQAYRVYVRVINPHTGEDMVCVSNGYMHPIDGYNLKEILVYFHKKNPKKYFVDVMEAIEDNR